MSLSYVFAILAAASNAASNTLQRQANSKEPPELSMHLRLIVDLVQRPVWLAGMVTVVVSFFLEAAALHRGRLAAVQPILVLELPMTLIVASRAFHSRLHIREWISIAVMSVGLVGFIIFLSPAAGSNGRAPALEWGIGIASTLATAAACVVASSKGGGARKPALLGVSSGIMFGLTAAFMKGAVGSLQHGVGAVLEHWQVYALALCGLAAFFLMQNALQAGRLLAAQPGITLADPAVAILWGIFVFNEHTRGGMYLLGVAASGLAITLGTVILSRSPLLEQEPARSAGEGSEGGEERAGRKPARNPS